MTITLTESAAKQINNQLAKRGSGLGLRIGVKQVGCSGYAYTYDYADTPARPPRGRSVPYVQRKPRSLYRGCAITT